MVQALDPLDKTAKLARAVNTDFNARHAQLHVSSSNQQKPICYINQVKPILLKLRVNDI